MKRLCMFLVAAVTALYLINAAAAPQNTSKPDANPVTAAAPAAFNAAPATRAWLDTMSPAARAKSDAYFEGGYWLLLWDFVVTLLVAWLLLGTGLSARLRD